MAWDDESFEDWTDRDEADWLDREPEEARGFDEVIGGVHFLGDGSGWVWNDVEEEWIPVHPVRTESA